MAKQKQPEYRINLRPYRILYWPFLLPVALLLALFNKISPIPFKIYLLRVDRIGQMASNQEQILCEEEAGLYPREFRFFVYRDHPSNNVLMDMQKRVMPIYNFLLPLFDVCHKMGGLGISSMQLAGITGRDETHLQKKTKQYFHFSEEELRDAKEECRALGIDPEKPFIPVLGRDNLYLSHIGEPTDMDSYRNVDINTYIPAMEYMAENYQVLRVGSVVRDALNTTHPNVLDYSMSNKRTELLDVYLSAQCYFFVSCGTGLDAIPAYMFRIPVMYANYIPPSYFPTLREGSLFIPKKYWHRTEKRYLSLREILSSKMMDYVTPRELDPFDVEVHDNTAEEILAISKEMFARMDGTWVDSEEDEALQKQFWDIYREKLGPTEYGARIGAEYLRNNPFWLN